MWTEKKRAGAPLKGRDAKSHREWRGTLTPAEELKSVEMVQRLFVV